MAAHDTAPLSQVGAGSVRWLWESYLPRGKLAILDGDPGVGKSLVTIDLAARLSRGWPLPDGRPGDRPHATLLLSGEDNAADTLRPRAESAGADLDRLFVVTAGDGALMRLPADAARLEEMIRERSAELVVVDPVMAFLPPAVAANSDQCVRGVLCLLADVASRTDCAILLVRHLRKKGAAKSVYRGLGSIGIIGAVRTGWLLAPHPKTPGLRVLAVTKSNLVRTPPPLSLRIRGDSETRVGVEWSGALEVTADSLGLPFAAPLRPRDRAGDWLLRQLAGGPRRVNDLLAAAVEEGIPDITLRRAKDDCRVVAHRAYVGGGKGVRGEPHWYWYDPDAPWPADAPFQKPRPGELPPLESLW